MHVLAIEPPIEVLSRNNSTEKFIKKLDQSTQLPRSYQGSRRYVDQSTQLSRSYRDCNKNHLKSSIDKPSVEEVSRLLKNSFSRREKHRYECNQACNSTKDPINILNSQKHLSIKILSTQIPKTNTHTLNKSNQFYISKTSQDSLVSIH